MYGPDQIDQLAQLDVAKESRPTILSFCCQPAAGIHIPATENLVTLYHGILEKKIITKKH